MKIINNTPEIPYQEESRVFDLGKIKKGTSKSFNFTIENSKHRDVRAGCPSCTKVTAAQKEENIELSVTYKAFNIGSFDKRITETLEDGTTIVFKLKGTGI